MTRYKLLKLIAMIVLVLSQGLMVWSAHRQHMQLMRTLDQIRGFGGNE